MNLPDVDCAASTEPRQARAVLCSALLLAGWMTLLFWPMLGTSFLFNDDALLFETGTCLEHPQVAYLPAIGRWLFPLLACPVWAWVDHIGELSWVRGFNLLGFALVGGLVAVQLLRRGLKADTTLVLAALWLVGPAVQFQVILANSVPHALGTLLAVAAFLRAEPAALEVRPWRQASAWLSVGLFYASACVYTPNALLYWMLLAARLTDQRDEAIVQPKVLGWLVTVGLLGSLAYTLTLKILYALVPLLIPIPAGIFGGHDASTVTSLVDRVWLLLLTLVPTAWSFWGPPGAWTFFTCFLTLLGAGGGLWLFRAAQAFLRGQARGQILAMRGGGVLLCLGGILGPQAVAGHLALSNRTMLALSGLGLLLAARSLESILDLLPLRWARATRGGLLLALMLQALLTIPERLERQVVAPAVAEGQAIQAELRENVVRRAPIRTLVVNRYAPEMPIRPELVCSDELGLLSSTFAQNLRGLILAHLLELQATQALTPDWEIIPRHNLRRFGSQYGMLETLPPGTAQINLRPFADSLSSDLGWGCGTLSGDRHARGLPILP